MIQLPKYPKTVQLINILCTSCSKAILAPKEAKDCVKVLCGSCGYMEHQMELRKKEKEGG